MEYSTEQLHEMLVVSVFQQALKVVILNNSSYYHL